jgi:heptosyltransferase-2
MSQTDKHAVLMPNWIGDFVMALAVIRQRSDWNADRLTLIVPNHLTELSAQLTSLPIIPYRRKNRQEYAETVKRIRHSRFRKVYLLPISFSAALLSVRARIPVRRGLGCEWRGLLLNQRLPSSLRNQRAHLTREYAAVLETDPNTPEKLSGPAGDTDSPVGSKIVFCPGARYGPAKRWSGFAALADALSDRVIVVLGGKEDAKEGEEIAGIAPQRVLNMAGKTSLVDATGILGAAALVVSNDSGLMHLAAFLGRPVIGLFGSTSPSWTRPIGPTARVLYSEEPCSPCFKRTCQFEHYDCLRHLSVRQVEMLCRDMLAHTSSLR